MDRYGIPAWFDGTLFRSHLEARWAIFFKALDIPWEYEPQGFVVDGTPYLPDFVTFPAGGMLWVEVKSDWDTDPAGVERWRKFAICRPQPSRAALLVGKPSVNGAHIVIGGDEDRGPLKGPWEDGSQTWRPCPSGYHFDLAYTETFRTTYAADECPDDAGRGGDERIEAAVKAALSHRFGRFGPSDAAA